MKIIIPQGKIPFIILDMGKVDPIRNLISWALYKNIYPVRVVVLTDYASGNHNLFQYFKKLENRGDIDIIRIHKNNPDVISSINIETLSPYYIYTRSNIVPADSCPKDLIPVMISAFKEYPQVHKVGTFSKNDSLKKIKGNYSIGEVGSEFALYRKGKSDFNVKKGNMITNFPYRTKEFEQDIAPENDDIKSKIIAKKIQKISDTPIMASNRLPKNKVFIHKTAKGSNTKIKFLNDTTCKGWNGAVGDIQIKVRRVKIKWRDPKHGYDVLDFDESFSSYSGLSTKKGRLSGVLENIRPVGKNLVNSHLPPATPSPRIPPAQKTIASKTKNNSILNYYPKNDNFSVVVAAFNLDTHIIKKFILQNQEAFSNNSIHLYLVTNRSLDYPQNWITPIVYNNPDKIWSLSKVLNCAIRGICDAYRESSIILKSDIDIIFSSKALKNIKKKTGKGKGLVSLCSHISAVQANDITNIDWKSLQKDKGGKGAAFALTVYDWRRVCGYNENLTGWGHDDTDLWNRCEKKLDVSCDAIYPVYHVTHYPRKNAKFPDRSKENKKIMKSGKRWDDPNWGKTSKYPIRIKTNKKKVTFIIPPVKNRGARALSCIKSLVTPNTSKWASFIIVEDLGRNKIDLSKFIFSHLIDHYVVNTESEEWNKSKLVNFGLKKVTTSFVAICDPDCVFDKNFGNKYLKYITQEPFSPSFWELECIETEEESRRGFFTCSTDHALKLNGYNENISKWGYEDVEFYQRIEKFNNLKNNDQDISNLQNSNGFGDLKIESYTPATDLIVVMGNGPSLKEIDFNDLRGYKTFGMNLAYRHWEKIGWWPTYHGCFDFVVTDNHKKEFQTLIERPDSKIEKHFLLRNISNSDKLEVIKFQNRKVGSFSSSLDDFGYGGNTGANCCQVAISLGYKKIILVGVDCNYVQVVDGATSGGGCRLQMIKTPDKNPNYFMDDYSRKGDVYNIPDAEIHHRPAWKHLANFAKKHNVDIVNCSSKSTLNCFRKGNFHEELESASPPKPEFK